MLPLRALVLLAGCTSAPPPDEAPSLLAPCHLKGVDEETRCGTLTVFEDREARSGRTLDLRVVVVPAVSPNPEPDPLFFLAGGPGQAATEVLATTLPMFTGIHSKRDLVFVDQRGTGSSNKLACDEVDTPDLAQQLGVLALDTDELVACRDALSERADLRLYTTPIAMDDLDQVREALGYDQINLYGGSYGTRAALVYMRRHPERVRTAILDGVAPTTMKLFLTFARDGQDAWDALVRDCAAEPGCKETFGDLDATLADLMQRLEETPEEATARHPRTGRSETVTLDRQTFAAHLRGLLYTPTLAALLPLSVSDAAAGRWEPFIAQTLGMSSGMSASMSFGMMLSVVCAEDLPRISEADREEAARDTFLGDHLVAAMADACTHWPRGEVPEGYNDPITSEVPTLILSGALDPVTPPRWGELVLETLPNGVHAVAPGAGHNVAPYGCTPRRMRAFVEAGTTEGLDVDCIGDIERPAFFVDFAGPAQ